MFSIKRDKTPSPDGFTAAFFHDNWDIVGSDVVEVVKSFFAKGYFLKEWNCTTLALVTKTSCHDTMRDYCDKSIISAKNRIRVEVKMPFSFYINHYK